MNCKGLLVNNDILVLFILFRLFYHVVDTDEAAAEILGRLNAKGWYGTANFYPINRLQQKGRVVLREESKNVLLHLFLSDNDFMYLNQFFFKCGF